jgi:hypothetical protein
VNGSTFDDDIYDEGGDATVKKLVDRMIQMTGKEAALFVPSGTMGNQICLRTHLHQPPHTILLDYRAHVQCSETGAIPLLSQATVTGVEPKNGVHLTLDDLKDRIVEEKNSMLTFKIVRDITCMFLIMSCTSSFPSHPDCFPRKRLEWLHPTPPPCARDLKLRSKLPRSSWPSTDCHAS